MEMFCGCHPPHTLLSFCIIITFYIFHLGNFMHKSEIGLWDLNEVNIVTTGYVLDFICTVTVT